MPPKTPKAKPRLVPRRGIGATAPDTTSGPAAPTSPVTTTSGEPIPTQTPIVPPAGRLDSLLSPASSRGGVVAGGGNGRGVPVPLKFKPRNVPRKSKEEREALDAKFEATLIPAVRPRGGTSTRGPRGGRGGRSGFGGRNDRVVTAGASGPFSLGSVTTRDRAQKIAVERGSDFGRHRQHSFNSLKLGKIAGDPQFLKPKSEEPVPDNAGYSASSSDSEGPRMDVEYISLLDDANSDDEDDMEAEPVWGAGAPVRVPRSAHVDRTAQVNTEASLSRKGKLDPNRKGREVLFEEAVKVKDEPPDGDDMTVPDIRSSPEAGRKKSTKTQSPEAKKKDVPVKTRRRSSSRRNKAILSSPEDKEELEREQFDRVTTLRELAGGFSSVKIDDDGDIGMTSNIDQSPQHRNAETENQIFLFQFPNILPQLVLPTKEQKREDDNAETIKPELTSEVPPHRPPPKPPSLLQRKLSAKVQQVLLESYPPPGIAGKLCIHRSGRMTMLWGASGSGGEDGSQFEMDVTRGTQCEFLQELVAMKQHSPWGDQDVDERGKRKGVAFSLGQVKGKFIVSPDFEKLLKGEKKKGKGRNVGKGKKVDKQETVEIVDL